jgi:hypothetical protein
MEAVHRAGIGVDLGGKHLSHRSSIGPVKPGRTGACGR